MCSNISIFNDLIFGKLIPEHGQYIGKKRMCEDKLRKLSEVFNIEFAQIYILPKIRYFSNGSNKKLGGFYMLYSGDWSTVHIDLTGDTILINHTHPRGDLSPSLFDLDLLKKLQFIGSPQKTSSIIPIACPSFKFNKNGKI